MKKLLMIAGMASTMFVTNVIAHDLADGHTHGISCYGNQPDTVFSTADAFGMMQDLTQDNAHDVHMYNMRKDHSAFDVVLRSTEKHGKDATVGEEMIRERVRQFAKSHPRLDYCDVWTIKPANKTRIVFK